MLNPILRIAAWAGLALIALLTLGPIAVRADLVNGDADSERFVAYLLVTLAFVWAYPNRVIRIVLLVVVSALVFEALQNLVPDRHGDIRDVVVKLAGAAAGLAFGALTKAFLPQQP